MTNLVDLRRESERLAADLRPFGVVGEQAANHLELLTKLVEGLTVTVAEKQRAVDGLRAVANAHERLCQQLQGEPLVGQQQEVVAYKRPEADERFVALHNILQGAKGVAEAKRVLAEHYPDTKYSLRELHAIESWRTTRFNSRISSEAMIKMFGLSAAPERLLLGAAPL